MSDRVIAIGAENKAAALKLIDQASITGDISLLYESLNLHPEILDELIDKKTFVNTPLHEAATKGHALFCAEKMNLMPSFGRKLNPDGFSPLHLALQHPDEHSTAALTLVGIDKNLVRVKGRDGITPLMYCAGSAIHNDTLAILLRDCPQAIFDLNTRSETALHYALRMRNCDGADIILKWLRRSSREKILDWNDIDGNKPLHLAIKHKCARATEMLVKKSLLNKRNNESRTPLDIAHDVGNPHAIKLLERKKAKRSTKLEQNFIYADFLRTDMSCWEGAIKTYTILVNDLDVEIRNVILVVAVLIATATYTAMLQPPGGVYQANASTTNRASEPKAGKMVMKYSDYQRFMPTNTLAFTLAIVVIIFVLPGRPYTVALHLSLLSLSYSCLIAMTSVSEEGRTSQASFYLSWILLALACVVKLAYYLLMKGLMWDVWWAPRCFVQVRNCVEGWAGDGVIDKMMSFMSKLRKQYDLTVDSLKEKP